MKLSVCLATYNEAQNIARCLRSVKDWVDEIIVVDGSSNDSTREIAKKHGARVYKTTNKEMFHINKQMAVNKAKNDWVLLLDADEEVEDELKKEIQNTIKSIHRHPNTTINGYYIPRKNIIFGKWIKHTGWYPDYQLRLFRKDCFLLPCKSIHEDPELKGESAKLKHHFIHYNYTTVDQFIRKMLMYVRNDANIYIRENQALNWQDLVIYPADEFIKRFIVWHGYKDGLHGLVLSLLQSFSRFLSLVFVWEKNGFKQQGVDLKKVFSLLTGKLKELEWWLIKSTNPKFIRKALNKIKMKFLLWTK
jgi:(heptosyl)LPS beta-1,4-glucosyltransferase